MQNNGELKVATLLEVYATPIQIRFKDTDSSVIPISTDAQNLPPPKDDNEQKSLSRAAKFGMGFGVGIPVSALLLCCVCCCKKCRKKLEEEQPGHTLADTDSVGREQDQDDVAPVPTDSFGSEQAQDDVPPPPYSKY